MRLEVIFTQTLTFNLLSFLVDWKLLQPFFKYIEYTDVKFNRSTFHYAGITKSIHDPNEIQKGEPLFLIQG